MPRTILHADLDAFYASVEQLDHPELRGKPVVVGGSADTRGVVAAASYEARKFGVHSAMPMREALRRCPYAVRVSPRFDRYRELSHQVMEIFRSLTPLVEPLSLDEAYLDVSAISACTDEGEALARQLKVTVKEATGLVVSVGVGTNKSVAKIASDRGKPDGLLVVRFGEEARFLAPLPIRSLWGIGPKGEARLAKIGIRSIGELAAADPDRIQTTFGSWGPALIAMARGIDEREVQPVRERKSVGAERTFPRDLPDGPELRTALANIAREVAERLASQGVETREIGLKLRYASFKTIARQMTLAQPTDDAEQIARSAELLLTRVAKSTDRFRLLGIHCGRLEPRHQGDEQASLWEAETPAPAP
jgi:DNA polymerase IV